MHLCMLLQHSGSCKVNSGIIWWDWPRWMEFRVISIQTEVTSQNNKNKQTNKHLWYDTEQRNINNKDILKSTQTSLPDSHHCINKRHGCHSRGKVQTLTDTMKLLCKENLNHMITVDIIVLVLENWIRAFYSVSNWSVQSEEIHHSLSSLGGGGRAIFRH